MDIYESMPTYEDVEELPLEQAVLGLFHGKGDWINSDEIYRRLPVKGIREALDSLTIGNVLRSSLVADDFNGEYEPPQIRYYFN